MAFDRDFAEALVQAMAREGWRASLPAGELPNPLILEFSGHDATRKLIVHARRITHQFRLGSSPSDHHRPAGEMHAQMIFDGDQRGAGARNYLRFSEDAKTVLFGFFPTDAGYVVAAYDPERHREYAYSASLQVKEHTIEQALKSGIAFQVRENDETVVVFHLDEIVEYLEHAEGFHNLTPAIVEAAVEEESVVRRAFDPKADLSRLPLLLAEERRRAVTEVEHYIRNRQFSEAIKRVYDRCAICGFQYDYVLEAAHIVPVSEGGTDTYDNGLGLCPNCHHMYDKGLILVDGNGGISINQRYVAEYDRIGRTGSLEDLRATLRERLWLPENEKYHPSAENLRRTFEARR